MYDINSSMSEFYQVIAEAVLSSSISGFAGLAAYILLAIGLYSIADRRGISKPWLAWIPFGQVWILGSISDQFQYVAMGRQKSKRKALLTLEILMTLLGVAVCVMAIAVVWQYVVALPQVPTADAVEREVMELFAPMMGILLLSLVLLGMSIAYIVVYYMALYDVYRSCEPANATLFTVLSIFLNGLLQGLLVLVSRKKDLGMPPRRDQVNVQPGYLPSQPTADPWQQNQQPRDPWAP